MLASKIQLNLSQRTLEDIALNALPLLKALGLELDEANFNNGSQDQMSPQGEITMLLFGVEDIGDLIVWG